MASLIKFASDVASGRHALSKFIPLGLWFADAILCGLVIWKVPCESSLYTNSCIEEKE